MSIYNQGGPSATSLNFIGFEDMAKNNTSPLIFNQVYLQYDQPTSAGRYVHAVAGFVPGQQPYLKPNLEIYNTAMYRGPTVLDPLLKWYGRRTVGVF